MKLRNADIKPQYDSISDDVYGDFFNPVFTCSQQCARAGGRFTSKNLATCAIGMQEFIQNDGRMKLSMLPEFSKEDIDAIRLGIRDESDVLSEGWIKDMSEISERFVDDHVKALSWMLANGNLDIRIVIPRDDKGQIVRHAALHESQVFKKKTGLFWDSTGDVLSFSGNMEYDDKMMGEYYHFRTYRSWVQDEKKYVDEDYNEFSQYWDGQANAGKMRLQVVELPEAIRESMIKIAPNSKSEIRLSEVPRLRPYQKEAVKMWTDAGCRGVLEMATGTGKTFTAIGCMLEILKKSKKVLVVIVCPFDNLERQWEAELARWNIESQVTSRNQGWYTAMKDGISALKVSDDEGMLVVITSYNTFNNKKFTRAVEESNVKSMLVADEVHNAGSATRLAGLSGAYTYRLGLSATLERYFDEQGTAALRGFFGSTVFALDLAQAIKHKFLVGYNYYPIYTDLKADEYEEYRKRTRLIAMLWRSKKSKDRERLERELDMRSRIILNAESKIDRFADWARAHEGKIKYTLVYCSETQMPRVKRILTECGAVNREITAENPKNPRRRAAILQEFANGTYDAIVANKVLDEGADVPAARTCVMLASTGNPKQFVQRRSRVLRRFPQGYADGSRKDHADIYDVIVMPGDICGYTTGEVRVERQIVASQINRQEMMAGLALNKDACMKDISIVKMKFSL